MMNISSWGRSAMKYSIAIMATLFFVGVGQANQALKLHNDLRQHVISEWVGADHSRAAVAEFFIANCMIGTPEAAAKLINDQPHNIYECGESNGASELMPEIKKVDGVHVTLAWPLSIII